MFYYFCNTQLRSYNTDTDTSALICDFKDEFPSAAFIITGSEGDASLDRRYWSFMVQDSSYHLLSVVVYDKTENKIVGRKDSGFPDKVNWVGMDMSGNHCFIGYDELTYAQLFSRDLKSSFTLPDGSNGHGDLALTADGKDVVVYQNVRTDYIAMADLDTGTETPLVEIPISLTFPNRSRYDNCKTG